MSETIEDIVAEMRELAKEIRGNSISNAYELLMGCANRIEAAVKALIADQDNWRKQALDEDARANATCEKSSQVGNAAARFKALQEIYLVCWKAGITMSYAVACGIIKAKSRAALAKPPRNCDLYATEEKAWEAFCVIHSDAFCPSDHWSEKYQTWLFAEAKGEAK